MLLQIMTYYERVVLLATPEGIIENYFVTEVTKYGALPLKFKSPSMNGVPDQIVISNGSTYFAEIKAPNEKPRALQIVVHERFQKHNVTVHVIDTKDGVDRFIRDTLKLYKPIKTNTNKTHEKIIKNAF